MAIHPTLSESCLKNSIKKFFIDNIAIPESISINFDVIYVQPEDVNGDLDQWLSVKFGNIEGGTLSRSHIIVHFFTRKDTEGVDLSLLRDMIVDKITDLNASDGLVRIPFYDLTWNQIGSILPIVLSDSEKPEVLKDGTKWNWIRINLCWGAK